MTPISPAPVVAAAVARSADRLARAMIDARGLGATLTERVEVERFVAGCVAWAACPREPDGPTGAGDRHLAQAALRKVAAWDASLAAEAAAWQLTLSAMEIAETDAPRRAAGDAR